MAGGSDAARSSVGGKGVGDVSQGSVVGRGWGSLQSLRACVDPHVGVQRVVVGDFHDACPSGGGVHG